MKVITTEISPVALPWKKPYAVPAQGVYPGDRIIVQLRTDEGLTGIGEALTYPLYGETLDSIIGAIKLMAEIVKGQDPFAISTIHAKIDGLIAGQSMARDAIDTALHDLMGKALGVPVYQLLGGLCQDRIPMCCSVGVATIDEAVEQVQHWQAQGVTQYHIKLMDYLGRAIDVEKVAKVRQALGDGAAIRIDANGTYPPLRTLRQIEEFGIVLVEQPAAMDDLIGMHEYARVLDTPILADESVLSPGHAYDVIRHGAGDVITIKGYQIGGLHRAKQAEALIRAARLPLFLGSGLKSSVGIAAHLQMCAAIQMDHWSFQETALGTFNLQYDLTTQPLAIENGCFLVPHKPGIGAELDMGSLRRMMKSPEVITI